MRIADCHSDRKHFARGMCKRCYQSSPKARARRAAYNQAHKAEQSAYHRVYRLSHKAEKAAYAQTHKVEKAATDKIYNHTHRAERFARRRGVSVESVRPWIEQKDRLCWLCGEDRATHLDHDHKTGKVRGWTHRNCNVVEGMVSASPDPRCLLATLMLAYT